MSVETTPASGQYLYKTGTDLGAEQVEFLQILLDGHTIRCLEAAGVGPGQRCLELGAGGGSIARWLADRVVPDGTVDAVDLDTSRIVPSPGVQVHRHDIRDGLPVAGPFDLIHARLLLMHLPDRERILRTLVDALAPGGWLVIGDFSDRPLDVLAAPSPADAALYIRVRDAAHEILMDLAGISLEWAHAVDRRMAEAGMVNIGSTELSETGSGGGTACRLWRNYTLQVEQPLLDGGLPRDELERVRELLLDPRFRFWFYQYVVTRGQKPTE